MAKEAVTTRRPDKRKREEIESIMVADIEAADMDGSQIPLTHRYRPRCLADFAGQDQAREIIEDAFTSGNVPRAWLIEGPTGTGKTTLARFISMRLNCEKPKGVDPCGACGSCVKYMEYPKPKHPCHIELNASAERGIDDVREVVAKTRYNVTGGKWQVIAFDEPQGLTPQAQEALLKPLEDPAGRTIYILSTTDPGKLKSTIIGRCRAGHIKVRPPSTGDLAKRLAQIAKAEGVEIPDAKKWLKRIAITSNHQPRDAVAVLEQVLKAVTSATRKGGTLDEQSLKKRLPTIIDEVQSGNPEQMAMETAGHIIAGNLDNALNMLRQGFDAHVIVGALTRVWAQVILLKVSPKTAQPYYARVIQGVFRDLDIKLDDDAIPVLIRGTEFLFRQYERAKSFVIDPNALALHTITGLWDLCGALGGEDDA